MSSFLDEVCDQLNLRWAWEKVRREATPGDIWFDEVELARFELELHRNLRNIAAQMRKGRYRIAPLRPLPFPKHPDKNGTPRVRQAFQVAVRDQVAWTAVVNVVGPQVDSKMPPWSYGNRLYRSIWVEEDADSIKHRRIGRYRHASGRLFLPFAQSWPIFRRHVYLATRAMIATPDLPDMDERTQEELEFQQRLHEEHRCPFVYPEYWASKRPQDGNAELYWCCIDLEKFYPTLKLDTIRDNIVGALPETWQADAAVVLKSMLKFPLDTCEWKPAELKSMDLRPRSKAFWHIPTGLYVAGFLANAGLLGVDAEVTKRLQEHKVAHLRYVDDHIILSYAFEELVQWVDEYFELLRDADTGTRMNLEKVEPEALGEFFAGRKRKRTPSILKGLKSAAEDKCRLDPKFPSPLMTKTLALVSGIARTDFNLLDAVELTTLTEQLEHLLLVDLPEEEMPEKTRLSFAATRLSRVAQCQIANNEGAVQLKLRRKVLETELERSGLRIERRREIKVELDVVLKSLNEESDRLNRKVKSAFELFRKVLRERPDRIRLWTQAILMCRLTGVKGLGDLLRDIAREAKENPLAGEYLKANTLMLLGSQVLIAARILRDQDVAHWRRNAARAFLEEVRSNSVQLTTGEDERWYLKMSSAQYSFGLYCASLVLSEQGMDSGEHCDISFRDEPISDGQNYVRRGAAGHEPPEWVWWAGRKTLRDLSPHAAGFVTELAAQLLPSRTTFALYGASSRSTSLHRPWSPWLQLGWRRQTVDWRPPDGGWTR